MTIKLELPPDLEARLVEEAKSKGLPLSEIVAAHLHRSPLERSWKYPTPEEVYKGFEAVADLLPQSIPPLSDEAVSRESIYTREDDWNK